MQAWLIDIARALAASPLNEWAIYSLRNVPGLPPILQSIHILSVAAIMASSVFICLRVLGWALKSQHLREMTRRLLPWTWAALLLVFLTGLMFVIARPLRYFTNPVFGWKLGMLCAAVILTLWLAKLIKKNNPPHQSSSPPSAFMKLLAFSSLCFWLLIVLAGRWIAYADYLFPPA